MLRVRDLRVRYGAVEALRGVSLDLDEGRIIALIGSNGAGKSTLLRTISGLHRAAEGVVEFAGRDVSRTPAHRIVRLGISHAPEGRRLFGTLSVAENLDMGAYLRSDRAGVAEARKRVYDLFPRLSERRRQPAGTLSGGEQQMLAIGRALMAQPRLLLLDEPSLGLAPNLVRQIFDTIAAINEEAGVTILLVEQNANMALRTAHYGYVLETGRIALSGETESLRSNEDVRRAYLGG